MAIEVEYGDTIVEFPDGTSPETMKAAMQKLHSKNVSEGTVPARAASEPVEKPEPETFQPETVGGKFAKALFPRSMDASQNIEPNYTQKPMDFSEYGIEPMWDTKPMEINPNVGKQMGAAISDVTSLLGRTAASTPEILSTATPGGVVGKTLTEKFDDVTASMAKTKSDKSGAAGFGADVLRSPAMGAGIMTGGAGLIPASMAAAAASQAEKTSEGQKVSPVGFAGETVGGVVGGKVVGKVAGMVGDKAVAAANRIGADRLFKQVIKTDAGLNKTSKEIFRKYEIRGPVEDALNHVERLVKVGSQKVNANAQALSDGPLGRVKIKAEALLSQIKPVPGRTPDYKEAFEVMKATVRDIAPDGNLSFKQLLDLRRALDSIRNFDQATTKDITKKVAGSYRKLVDTEMNNMLKQIPADAVEGPMANRVMVRAFKDGNLELHELLPVANALAKKAGRVKLIQEDEGMAQELAKAALKAVNNPLGATGAVASGLTGTTKQGLMKTATSPELTYSAKQGFQPRPWGKAGATEMREIRQEVRNWSGYLNKVNQAVKKLDLSTPKGKSELNRIKVILVKKMNAETKSKPFTEEIVGEALGRAISTGESLESILAGPKKEEAP